MTTWGVKDGDVSNLEVLSSYFGLGGEDETSVPIFFDSLFLDASQKRLLLFIFWIGGHC